MTIMLMLVMYTFFHNALSKKPKDMTFIVKSSYIHLHLYSNL